MASPLRVALSWIESNKIPYRLERMFKYINPFLVVDSSHFHVVLSSLRTRSSISCAFEFLLLSLEKCRKKNIDSHRYEKYVYKMSKNSSKSRFNFAIRNQTAPLIEVRDRLIRIGISFSRFL